MQDGRGGLWDSPGVVAALLGLAAVVRVGAVVNKALDPDESQHLQAAWLVAQGQVPYADFWEHHAPLLYYLLAPLTRWLAESPAVYFAARAAMTLVAAVALLLVYRLARRLGPAPAAAGVGLLAFLPEFVEHTTEVRPDVPALAAWLAAVLGLVRWREAGRPWWLWAAGLGLGVAGTFTPKAIYGALGLAAVVVIAALDGTSGAGGRALGALARLAGGAGAPLLALLGGLWLGGGPAALDGFVEHVLARNLDFPDFTKHTPVGGAGAGFGVLAAGGVAAVAWRAGWRLLRHPLHGPLLVPAALIALALALPRTPAVYRHAWLPILAAGAVYAGLALAELGARAGAREGRVPAALAALALLGGLVIPAAASVREAVRDGNSAQLRTMRLELRHACPGEPVLDGTALYVFRPAAHRFRVLINGVRYWVANGVVPEERLVEDLQHTRPRVAYADRRVRAMIGPVAGFLKAHYVALSDGLLVPGAMVAVPGGPPGGRADIELLVPGPYRLAASPGIQVAIDQAPARPGLVALDAGRHEVRWTGPRGTIALVGLTCPERRALAGRADAPGTPRPSGGNRLTSP